MLETIDGQQVNVDIILKESVSLKPKDGKTEVTLKSGNIVTLKGEWELCYGVPYFGSGEQLGLRRLKSS